MYAMNTSATITEYFETATAEQKAEYQRLTKVVKQVAPKAVETISYGMPAFKIGKKPLVYFGIFKNHLSIFPASGAVIQTMGAELAEFKTAKGTLRYTLDKPIPNELLERMLRVRLVEMTETELKL